MLISHYNVKILHTIQSPSRHFPVTCDEKLFLSPAFIIFHASDWRLDDAIPSGTAVVCIYQAGFAAGNGFDGAVPFVVWQRRQFTGDANQKRRATARIQPAYRLGVTQDTGTAVS